MRFLALFALFACNAAVKNRAVTTPPQAPAALDPSFVAELKVNVSLIAQSDVPLRAEATADSIMREMITSGDEVSVYLSAEPVNEFIHVNHNGLTGWALGSVFSVAPPAYVPPPPTPAPPPQGGDQTPDPTQSSPPPADSAPAPATYGPSDALALAETGVGFSYWWGGGAWLQSGATEDNAGVCTGDCPSCTHSGTYGADCSGYVAKIWQVPSTNTDVSKNEHPYSTYDFYNYQIDWTDIDRTDLQPADAFVYNDGSEGHIFLYVSGDPAGSLYTFESRGCATGIVYNLRTLDEPYKPIRRNGW